MDRETPKDRCRYPTFPIPAVGVAVISENDRLLMIKRGKPPAMGLWSVPGGTIELGETVFDAARREVFEETSLLCNPCKIFDAIDAIYKDDDGKLLYHYIILYVVARCEEKPPIARDDALEAGWFSIDEIKNFSTPGKTYQLLKRILYNIKKPNSWPEGQ